MIDGHGGNIYQLARRLACRPSDISDMSANVNPLGPMPALIEHLTASISSAIATLPDVDAGGIVGACGPDALPTGALLAGPLRAGAGDCC